MSRTPTEPAHDISSCVEWTKFRDKWGYGRLCKNGKGWFAHRYIWTKEKGPIPDGLCVLHKCDNPACVNIAHLFLGTHLDNSKDKIKKGRNINLRGSLHGRALINDDTALQIRALKGKVPGTEIAKAVGLKKSAVYNIMSGKSWRHL